MIDEFANRQAMHLTIIELLDNTEYKPVWENQNPVAFTARSTTLRSQVDDLTTFIARQEANITGRAEQKDREETELETIAHETGSALATYLEDNEREGEATEIDLSLSAWRRLRDTALLAKATLLQSRFSAALIADAVGLAEYGLDPEDLATYGKELEDYRKVIESPSSGIASRKALTASLRPAFREVSATLKAMDRLILRFRKTDAGKAFADNWKTARTIRDLGANNRGPLPPSP